MKKLLFAVLFSMVTLAVSSEVSAFHKKRLVDLGDCPVPCCEKQEMITVRHEPKVVCGYVCPDGSTEVEA